MIKRTIPPDSQRVFRGIRFDVHSVALRTPNGEQVRREVVIHPGAVVILPILDDERIVMIRNERFAVSETLWELPAGTLEPNEECAATAARELAEETGYAPGKLELLHEFYPSPGICNEVICAFVATDLTYVGQNLDDTENITAVEIPWDRVMKMVKDGDIVDAKTLITLMYYRMYC